MIGPFRSYHFRTADAAMVKLCRGACKRMPERMDEKMPQRRDLLRLMPQPKRKQRAV